MVTEKGFIMSVIIKGEGLTVEDVIRVSHLNEKVKLDETSKEKIQKSRAYVEKKVEEGAIIYGITTGFGKFADTVISREETAQLQRNLILSHACGMGEPLDEASVRSIMLLRCNALSRGFSGIRLSTVETLVEMLNKGVHPVVYEKGSLGASGDLAPLSHVVLTMLGEGEAFYKGKRMSSKEAMKKAKIATISLEAKEGLALINGTQVMTAIGLNVLWQAMQLVKNVDIASALTSEALNGITLAYDSKVHEVRGHKGQMECAENLLSILQGSENAKEKHPVKVQDPYSLRCVPQVHGATRDAIKYVYDVVTREINAVTDNPIIFPDQDQVISGGNFHGQPMAIAFDFLKIAVSELANISERRAERMINPSLSEGLEPFLTKHPGVCSGFMIAQYSAASMVSENKVYSHPASVDSIPSSGNQEDHVSMGTTSARTARMVLENVQRVVAIEMLTAAQSIWLRGEKGLGKGTKAAYDYIRTLTDPIDEDVILHYEMEKVHEAVKANSIVNVVEKEVGPLY